MDDINEISESYSSDYIINETNENTNIKDKDEDT